MLQVARLAPKLLSDSSGLVVEFLRSQINEDGGFKDRSGKSDLYYTVFGLEGLLAFQADLPVASTAQYLGSFGGGESLDLVHLTCLARCWAALPGKLENSEIRHEIQRRIETFRALDGGYCESPQSKHGTAYSCFLSLGAYQDLEAQLPNPAGLVHCLKSLVAGDGAFANQPKLATGTTPATAAAVTLLRQLDEPIHSSVGDWLLSRCHPEGGFFATPATPVPDLLSTATALHALSGLHVSLDTVKEPCLNFVDTLWSSKGAFYGSWADETLDCEYTYYGLLALGHLSLW
jgi:prenyltransferase beta subunit